MPGPEGREKTTNPETTSIKDEEERAEGGALRQDVLVLVTGIGFICVLIGAIYGLGIWRGWYAPSGAYHNTSLTSPDRFLPEPDIPDPSIRGRSGTDASGKWYYWKLKPKDVTVWTRLFVWLCYCGHQLTIWGVLFLAQLDKAKGSAKDKYSTSLGKYAWISLALNIFFHLLHLLQTHITYDGLAQDVSIASSQSSVIMLLIYVMLLEYAERGLLLGWPSVRSTHEWSKKVRLNYGPVYLTRKYHGYAFAWASIYTFWYHPMENTYGHALGFFHTWIIMLQGSLMYTPVHKNRYWRFILEAWVALHGSLVAVQTSNPAQPERSIWPMFTFGFCLILVLTWLFIMPFWWKVPSWLRVLPLLVWLGVTVGSYSVILDSEGRPFTRLQEVVRMPAFFYPYFLFCWLVIYFFSWVDRKVTCIRWQSSPFKRGIFILFTLLSYIFLVVISSLVEVLNVSLPLLVFTAIFVAIYCLVVGYTMILIQHAFNGIGNVRPVEMDMSEHSEHSNKDIGKGEINYAMEVNDLN